MASKYLPCLIGLSRLGQGIPPSSTLLLRSAEDALCLQELVESSTSSACIRGITSLHLQIPDGREYPGHTASTLRQLRRLGLPIHSIRMYGIPHWPSGIQRPLFPWQQGHHLVSFSSLCYLSIRHFRVPSFTCLVRLLGSVPLLQSVAPEDVHWNTLNDAVTAVNPSPGCRLLERIILDGCSDRCAVGWVFAAICLYSAGKRYPRRHEDANEYVHTVVKLISAIFGQDRPKQPALIFTRPHSAGETCIPYFHLV